MKSKDLEKMSPAREALQKALREQNADDAAAAFNQLLDEALATARRDYEELKDERDAQALAARGVRQLTTQEREYWQKFGECAKSDDPKQALTNANLVLPKTVVEAVFDELQTQHPLLSAIDFTATAGQYSLIIGKNAEQSATWGDLCDSIVTELMAGFVEVSGTLCKLTAFLPVCKAMIDLGPEWLDRYAREVLYEAWANGLEAGIVAGDGNKKPIGMVRKVGDGVTVTGGAYPKKTAIAVTSFSAETVGKLLSMLAVDADGKPRRVQDVILLVNPQDYYQLVIPATSIMAPDGTYRQDVMPSPMRIIQTAALSKGEAVIGIAPRYFAALGSARDGRIEYSDHAKFLEDKRVYIVKGYANGMPKDNNAFLLLDISGLRPLAYRVEVEDQRTKSNVATLSALNIGGLSLTPAFAAATLTYTATTSNASDTVTALPADAAADIEVKVGDNVVANGSTVTWATGANTVKVKVTAEDGTTTKTYTVTVTKS